MADEVSGGNAGGQADPADDQQQIDDLLDKDSSENPQLSFGKTCS